VFQSAVYARRSTDELRAIVAAGANVDEAGSVGLPPLVVSIDQYEYHRQVEIVQMLLDAGAYVDGRAADGDTPLLRMMYVEGGIELENVLLAAGADPNAANNAGQRPLSVAIRARKTLSMIDRLLDEGADLNADVQGVPLWAYALEHNPLYVSESHVQAVAPILDRFVNHPSLIIDLSAPGIDKALARADSNPLVKPYADVIRARAAAASSCAHAPCVPGGSLDPGCGTCVQSICDADPFCCDQAWDNVCVSQVASVCGASCD
jgi:ankyrin repeat protein